eukprot:GFKZ01011725.1.p2 GENE.GFKZ01011725.1~~GFKZ01011725.1.p2  ORF type:complete len:132 (-),score=1.65 GFKZ01011725.1:1016-1411(-)
MIAASLLPYSVTTKGDLTLSQATLILSLVQSCPLSPTLFLLYINSLALALNRAAAPFSQPSPCTMFADDVLLHDPDLLSRQQLLTMCQGWALTRNMRWNPTKSKVITQHNPLPPPASSTESPLTGPPPLDT